jgi:hypothetical protein
MKALLICPSSFSTSRAPALLRLCALAAALTTTGAQGLPGVAAPASGQSMQPPRATASGAPVAPVEAPLPPPPTAQAYVNRAAWRRTFLRPHAGADFVFEQRAGRVGGAAARRALARRLFRAHTRPVPYQQGARFDGKQVMLPVAPQNINGTLYVPWTPIAEALGIKWRIVTPPNTERQTARRRTRRRFCCNIPPPTSSRCSLRFTPTARAWSST